MSFARVPRASGSNRGRTGHLRHQCHWSSIARSAGGDRSQREEQRHDRAAGKPDPLLTTAQSSADQHREREREQGCGSIEPVDESAGARGRWPPGPARSRPGRHQGDHHAQVETDNWEDPWSQKSGYRGYRANRSHDRQYDTVPIMDQHEAYGIETVGYPNASGSLVTSSGRLTSPGFVNDRPCRALASLHKLVA